MHCLPFLLLLLILCVKMVCNQIHAISIDKDILTPFHNNNVETSTRRKNRLSHKFYEVFNTKNYNKKNKTDAHYSIHSFAKSHSGKTIFGHKITISDGFKMLSVLEPKQTGGCNGHLTSTVLDSSKQRECLVAISAGFFNENTGQCFGNVVSDGQRVNQFRGLKSANFGIRMDGSVVVGYIKEEDITEMRHSFKQLVTGVGWVLRNGEDYLKESLEHEQCNLDNLQEYFDARSARTFLGHDATGNIKIIQIEGKTGMQGITLSESVDLLKSFGLVNAINLNGAGAATLVVNDTIVNYPSNNCYDKKGNTRSCEMEVSSILCIHKPDTCVPGKSCSGKGECFKGKCKCFNDWIGSNCEFNGKMLKKCCWRNYHVVIALSTIISISILLNVFLCDLFMLYRFRNKDLTQPRRRQKDRLRTYLKESSFMSSNDEDESADVLTSAEVLNNAGK